MTLALSIIIPARNEAETLTATLLPLQGMRRRGGEVIVVDGESRDETLERARPLADRVLTSPPGRARQMNAGARIAGGEVLWFLHADTRVPEEADGILLAALAGEASYRPSPPNSQENRGRHPPRQIQRNPRSVTAPGQRVSWQRSRWARHHPWRIQRNATSLIAPAQRGRGRHHRAWGRFDARLSGDHRLLTLVARMMNLRSRLTGIATGDQGIFVHRDAFHAVAGFPDLPLMEDIALSRRLKALAGRPACLRTPLVTSSRRWEENGIARTILLMWGLRLAFALGTDPARLARWYHPSSTPGRKPLP
uniref:Glycosyl transferase family 2 n=1 Tax=Candidatus Kentrum eta TaxID=2126337 RepID=A0A450USW2_9GAMM|nr:MAG: Glycosyl transferase family 2 [Candidatus Kentron sp. H]VFJ96254.1 MAG: Glycosyl transferase family 2 [Candidatus Kentron sp. H]VFK02384.1 MAG: Glycosyl transferase family 2 [Candidatus Kentron sp. H]